MATTTMTSVDPFVDATDLLNTPDQLQDRAREEGYLFFKNLLDPDPLLNLRQQILKICQTHGWLQEGTPLIDGIPHPDVLIPESRDPAWQAFYCDIQKCRDFHALALNPAILHMLETLFGESVLPHPRNILRAMFPNSERFSTPPHQDNFYIGGSKDTWTVWFPLGDCSVELGSLACAPGTHRLGNLDVHAAEGAGGRAVDPGDNTRWVGGDFDWGDVLILHSLTIHQGRDNLSKNRLRLSCDYRYQPRSHPVREDSLQPHMGWQTWEEIYTDWPQNDPVKYYWQAWDLDITQREA